MDMPTPPEHLYGDWQVTPSPPFCPALRRLGLVTGAEVDALLAPGLADDLRKNFEQLAKEAKKFNFLGDAYPNIIRQGTWQQVHLYTVRDGWAAVCKRLTKTICRLIRGRLRSEQQEFKQAFRHHLGAQHHDEAVTLFSVAPGGWVPLHQGQDKRINVHICLWKCNKAWIEVAGRRHYYKMGELLAFDDPMDHEIVNTDLHHPRLVLGLGVLHPDLRPEHKPCY